MPASERFQQLELRFTDPVQHGCYCEKIRDIMLADETVATCSRATGAGSGDRWGEGAPRSYERQLPC